MKLALLLSLLALGALGLFTYVGGDDDQTTAASETETTAASETETTVTNSPPKSCGSWGRYRFAVVEGDVSCRVARGVMRGNAFSRLPGSWVCSGPDARWECDNDAGDAIRADVRKKILRRWRAHEAAASETETTGRVRTRRPDSQSCGSFGRYGFAVVQGDISCREARGVMDGFLAAELPSTWSCSGGMHKFVCFNEARETIRAHVHKGEHTERIRQLLESERNAAD